MYDRGFVFRFRLRRRMKCVQRRSEDGSGDRTVISRTVAVTTHSQGTNYKRREGLVTC